MPGRLRIIIKTSLFTLNNLFLLLGNSGRRIFPRNWQTFKMYVSIKKMPADDNEFSFKDLFFPLTNAKIVAYLFLLGFLVFSNMLLNNFLWDDISYLVKNPEITGLNLSLFFRQNMFNNNGQYRPLTETYFALLYRVFSLNAFYFHLVQLLLHQITAVMVHFLFKKFFKPLLAFCLSLIFLVHPMQVESVSYISSAGCILFFTVSLPAFFLLFRKNLTRFQWIIIGLLFLLSLLIKESGLLVMVVSIIYALFFNRKHLKGISIMGFLAFVVYLLFRLGVGGIFYEARPLVPFARLSLPVRLLNIPSIIFYYFKTFVFPKKLFIDQQWSFTDFGWSNLFFPLVILCLVFLPLACYGYKLLKNGRQEGKTIFFFLLWVIIGLGMYSQIVTLDRTVADRWMYFPLVGFLGLLGVIISLLPFFRKNSPAVIVFLLAFAAFFSIRTLYRNANWHDGITLYSHDTKIYTNYIMENDFAAHLTEIHDYQNALVHQEKSVALFPFELNILNLGRIYELSGNLSGAERYYSLALKSKTYYAWSHDHIIHSYTHLAKLLLRKGNDREALNVIKTGLRDYGDDRNYMSSPTLWLLLALADKKTGDLKGAVSAAKKASDTLPLDPNLKELYQKLSAGGDINFDRYYHLLLI